MQNVLHYDLLSKSFFLFSLSPPIDLKNNAENINIMDAIIDERIFGIELWKINPIIITTKDTIPNMGLHFLRISFNLIKFNV